MKIVVFSSLLRTIKRELVIKESSAWMPNNGVILKCLTINYSNYSSNTYYSSILITYKAMILY
jgi:hypothetical protein